MNCKKWFLMVSVLMVSVFSFGRGTPVRPPTNPNDATRYGSFLTVSNGHEKLSVDFSVVSNEVSELKIINSGSFMPIHIFAGQSNMEANPKEWGALPVALQTYQSGSYFSAYVMQGGLYDTWEPLGVHPPNSNVWGPYITFTDEILKIVDKVTIVTVAHGGTSLLDWLDQDDVAMYSNISNYLSAAISEVETLGYTPVIRSINWAQGETDAISATTGDSPAYYTNFITFITRLKNDFNIDDTVPVNIARLCGNASGVTGRTYYSDVRTDENALANDFGWINIIDTDDLVANTNDNVHYVADSVMELGNRFFANVEAEGTFHNANFEVDISKVSGGKKVSDFGLIYANYFEDVSQSTLSTTYNSAFTETIKNPTYWQTEFSSAYRGGVAEATDDNNGLLTATVDNSFTNGIDNFTVSAFFRAEDDLDTFRWICSFDGNVKIWFDDLSYNSFRINGRVACGAVNYTITGYVSPYQWHHICLVYDTNTLSVYLNGYLLGSEVTAASGVDGVNTLYLGQANLTQQAFRLGQIDDFLIFDRSLSADEVYNLYFMGLNGERFSPSF